MDNRNFSWTLQKRFLIDFNGKNLVKKKVKENDKNKKNQFNTICVIYIAQFV